MGCVLRGTNCLPDPFTFGQGLCCELRSIQNVELRLWCSSVVDHTTSVSPGFYTQCAPQSVVELGSLLSGPEGELGYCGNWRYL